MASPITAIFFHSSSGSTDTRSHQGGGDVGVMFLRDIRRRGVTLPTVGGWCVKHAPLIKMTIQRRRVGVFSGEIGGSEIFSSRRLEVLIDDHF